MDGIELYRSFLSLHEPQLRSSGIPEFYWKILAKKLREQIFDSGLVFQLARIDYDDADKQPTDPVWKLFVSDESGISTQDPGSIYLVDHAWVYDVDTAKQNLFQVPGLLDRMCNLMGYDVDETEDDKVEFVLSEMWRYNQNYAFANAPTADERVPVWYIMDEVGSAINHSDDPNFRAVPFLHVTEGVTYTLLYPLKNVEFKDEVTRDFVEGQAMDGTHRRALLLPWRNDTLIDESFLQSDPEDSYFLQGHVVETIAENPVVPVHPAGTKFKVFTQYSVVAEFLTDPNFEVTDDKREADILWLTTHFKEYGELAAAAPSVFVNQFPFEHVLTIKDLLCVVCRRKSLEGLRDSQTLDNYPDWLPATFNLKTELVEFVSYFEHRKAKNLDNHWICKPWNLARGLDTHITNNLYHVLKLSSSGPKIAQKYIVNPVLFERPSGIGRVKFDVRYVVLLKSVDPLEVYAYSNFFLRFANKKFALNNFHDYEQHFTVMNYSEEAQLYHLRCADFLVEWEKQYPEWPWHEKVERRILRMLREVFEAAADAKPPRGIAPNPQSRALYAADVMLEWKDEDMRPALLEVNFTPDCKRACDYYPQFYNDIFKLLFLDVKNPTAFRELIPHGDANSR